MFWPGSPALILSNRYQQWLSKIRLLEWSKFAPPLQKLRWPMKKFQRSYLYIHVYMNLHNNEYILMNRFERAKSISHASLPSWLPTWGDVVFISHLASRTKSKHRYVYFSLYAPCDGIKDIYIDADDRENLNDGIVRDSAPFIIIVAYCLRRAHERRTHAHLTNTHTQIDHVERDAVRASEYSSPFIKPSRVYAIILKFFGSSILHMERWGCRPSAVATIIQIIVFLFLLSHLFLSYKHTLFFEYIVITLIYYYYYCKTVRGQSQAHICMEQSIFIV